MHIVIIIIIVLVAIYFISKNKEKERQDNQRKDEAERLKKNYSDGYYEWSEQRYNKFQLENNYRYVGREDYILSHKEEIIKLHNEIIEKKRSQARTDEKFEVEQKRFSDQCCSLYDEYLKDFGKYYYYVEWSKRDSSGRRSNAKFKICQFFPDAVCLDQELDYTVRKYERDNVQNIPALQSMTRQFSDLFYDRINSFILNVANQLSRPLVVVLVDYKIEYRNEWSVEAISYHLNKIRRDIDNTIVVPLSQLDKEIVDGEYQIEHVIIIDVFTQNAQIEKICSVIESRFDPSRAAISYISLLKCYEKNEMEKILEEERIRVEERRIKSQALDIRRQAPVGFERWKFSLDLNGFSGEITDQMIVEAKETIINQQRQFNSERENIIERIKQTVRSSWNHLTQDFSYKYLLRYYPTTCAFEVTNEEWENRYRVWNFKNDPQRVSQEEHDDAMAWVIDNVKRVLVDDIGREALTLLTLVCIPASSMSDTKRRYLDFSEQLCKATGMSNAYPHIRIVSDATPKHLGGSGEPTIDFDTDYFKNKKIILFDDVITSGNSMLRMKAKLEGLEATVIAGISIGKTFHHRP